jgi:hypothetical protein
MAGSTSEDSFHSSCNQDPELPRSRATVLILLILFIFIDFCPGNLTLGGNEMLANDGLIQTEYPHDS